MSMKSPMIRPTDVAQAQLPRNFVRRFQIGLQNCLFDVAAALVSPRVYVDGDERFGFVDHDITAAFQPDLAMKSVVDLLLDPESLEDRRGAIVELNAVAGAPGNLPHHLLHSIDRRAIVADHLVDFVREEIADGPVDQIRLLKDTAGRGFCLDRLFDFRPLLEEETQIAHKIAGTLAFADGANNHPDALRNLQAAQDFSKSFPFLRVLDFSRDAAAIAVGHENQIAPGEAEVGRHARAFRSDGALGDLDDHVRADGINARDILGRDPFFRPPVLRPIDLLDAAVERGGNGVPKMEERIFFEADVHEHRLQPHLYVPNFAFVDAADNVAGAVSLDVIFFETAVFEEGDAALQFLDADYQFVAGLGRTKT